MKVGDLYRISGFDSINIVGIVVEANMCYFSGWEITTAKYDGALVSVSKVTRAQKADPSYPYIPVLLRDVVEVPEGVEAGDLIGPLMQTVEKVVPAPVEKVEVA